MGWKMSTQLSNIIPIPLQNLLIDLQNPRYDPRKSQREALHTIVHDQGQKLVNLAEDILDKGLNHSDLVIVTPLEDDKNMYIVLEGNRRVAALKLVLSPSLVESLDLPQKMTKKFKELNELAAGELADQIYCVVMPKEDANYWIQLKHTGENEGVGVVTWDGRARHRFRGTSPALQAIELVEHSNYLDKDTKSKLPKIAITNIERLLNTPDSRDLLGVEVKNQQLSLRHPEDEALARLAIIVSDVANGRIRVTHLDTREQRIEYARDVALRPLPKPYKAKGTTVSATAEAAEGGRRISPERKTLIPRRFKIVIPHTRINKIYWELQRLDVEKFTNSCSVMFRVFVEMSIDDFAQNHSIPLVIPRTIKTNGSSIKQTVEMNLRDKLKTIANYLEHNGHCNKDELRGVRSLIANRDHVLSVSSLNAYVHNKDYSPVPSDLKSSWDNVQVFIQRLWTV